MLMPKKTKYRKSQRGKMRGQAYRGSNLDFGEYALQAVECGRINSRQIEAGRVAINRHVKRGGKLWIRIFPDKPISKKPAEVRQGKGKGAVDHWVATIKPGRILFEMEGVDIATATRALALAGYKLPVKTKVITREDYLETC